MYEFMRAIQGTDHFITLQQKLAKEFTICQSIKCWCEAFNQPDLIQTKLYEVVENVPNYTINMKLDALFRYLHAPGKQNNRLMKDVSISKDIEIEWRHFIQWVRVHFFTFSYYKGIEKESYNKIELKQLVAFEENIEPVPNIEGVPPVQYAFDSVMGVQDPIFDVVVDTPEVISVPKVPIHISKSFISWRKLLKSLNTPYDIIVRIMMKNGNNMNVTTMMGIGIQQIDYDNQTITYLTSKRKRVISYPAYIMNKLKSYIQSTKDKREDYFIFINRFGDALGGKGVANYLSSLPLKYTERIFTPSKIKNCSEGFFGFYTEDEILGYE